MRDQLPPEPPDLSLLLPRSTYWQLVHELQSYLPPPIDDTPEARAHRDRAAIADVASMLPANAEEARVAARSVAADAQAAACLRQARKYEAEDVAIFLKCSAQAASMIRLANSTRSLLARLQAARRKREADEAARTSDAWTEHAAVGLMADVVGLAAPEPPPPASEPQERQDSYSQLTEAEQYAINYPRRAAEIRACGGLPEPCRFGPPSAELVRAIVTGTSPILLELDRR